MTRPQAVAHRYSGPVQVTLDEGLSAATIGVLWRKLEETARPSFFLSWCWIGSWLEQVKGPSALLTARRNGKVVGLAVVCRSVRRPLVPVTGLHLHETGDSGLDGIYIEYNGLLTAPGDAEEVVTACLAHLATLTRGRWGWDEVHLSGVPAALAKIAAADCPHMRIRSVAGCPVIDLAEIRGRGGDYLDAVSRNTRHQVRRSIRLYEEEGPLRLDRANTVEGALAHLDGLKTLHQRYWRGRGKPGAFAHAGFENFHRRLIETALPAGHIDLCRVAAGERTLGYLYNFVRDGMAYSYQSGFAYDESDSRRKPGLVAHALTAEGYLRAGLSGYRLMAGDTRYKRSLATGTEDLYWVTLRRDRLTFRIEDLLRAAKAMFSR